MLDSDMEAVDFVELYEQTLDEVHRYASRLTGGDRTRTDELVQETYLSVLRRLDNGGEPIDPTVPYLMATCRSRFLDGLRSEQRGRWRAKRVTRAAVSADSIDVDHASAEQAIAALATLTDIQRAAIVLRFVDDLRVDDVARDLDRSVRATESLLVRAHQALRDGFSEGIDS